MEKATYLLPSDKGFASQPFVAWKVSRGPSEGKYIAVNEEGRLLVQAFDLTPCRLGSTFVATEVCPVQ